MKGLQYKMKGFELNIKGFSLKLKEFQNPGSEKVFLTPFQQNVILTWAWGYHVDIGRQEAPPL